MVYRDKSLLYNNVPVKGDFKTQSSRTFLSVYTLTYSSKEGASINTFNLQKKGKSVYGGTSGPGPFFVRVDGVVAVKSTFTDLIIDAVY